MRAAAAAARAAEERRKGVEQQVSFQVFNSYYALRTATQRVRTSGDLLASATQSEQVALGRYKAGAGSLLDLLTAQRARQIWRDAASRDSGVTQLAQAATAAGQPFCAVVGTGPEAAWSVAAGADKADCTTAPLRFGSPRCST